MSVGYSGFFAAALIALALTVASVFFLGKRGPWGSIWTFFLVLFLTLWTVSIYVAPIGPVYWGVAWIPLAISGLIITVLLIAAMPHPGGPSREKENVTIPSDTNPNFGHGTGSKFFWALIILFIIAIIIGMTSPQRAL
jgi:hypothetical protein